MQLTSLPQISNYFCTLNNKTTHQKQQQQQKLVTERIAEHKFCHPAESDK